MVHQRIQKRTIIPPHLCACPKYWVLLVLFIYFSKFLFIYMFLIWVYVHFLWKSTHFANESAKSRFRVRDFLAVEDPLVALCCFLPFCLIVVSFTHSVLCLIFIYLCFFALFLIILFLYSIVICTNQVYLLFYMEQFSLATTDSKWSGFSLIYHVHLLT